MSSHDSIPSLLPPFGSAHTSQLLTLQCPNTIATYTDGGVQSLPIDYMVGSDLSKSARPEQTYPTGSISTSQIINSSHFMTPQSSPQSSRSQILTTPPRGLSVDSFITPHKSTFVVKSELSSLDFASSSSTVPAQHTAPPSRLSSPFTERHSSGDRTPTKHRTPRRDITRSSSPIQRTLFDDVFSQTPYAGPILAAPSPQRVKDEEAERIRLLLADRELARIHELQTKESISRLPSSATSVETGAVGITVTPNRGRRLKLFQETSEESFEESLMVNGYRYGGSTIYAKDRPHHQFSQHTLDWLEQRSPGSVLPSRLSQPTSIMEPPSDKEITKRKRLAAFRTSFKTIESARLVPTEIQGKGRLLLNVDEHNPFREDFLQESSSSTRSGNRRKRKGNANRSSPNKIRIHPEEAVSHIPVVNGPNWPDSEFPWCLKAIERTELIKEEEEERMRWIERFLDRDTDEEDSDEEDIMPSSLRADLHDHPSMTSRKGRGKMVPIKSEPDPRVHILFPTDPADARAALISRRVVRALNHRRVKQKGRSGDSDLENEDDICICGGKTDSRNLVLCEDCERWYHLRCMGIKSVAELGGDEDPWYCFNCLETTTRSQLDCPPSDPTLVPTDDDRASSPLEDPLFFNGSLEQSPLANWSTSYPPTTPTRRRNMVGHFSVPESSSSAISTSKGGPYTPVNSSSFRVARVHTTPGFLGDADAESNFDPASTPSRGIKIGAAFVTPKNNSAWSNSRAGTGGLFQTPLRGHSLASRSQWTGESGSVGFSSPSLPRLSSGQDIPGRGSRIPSLTASSSCRLFESPLLWNNGLGGRNTGGSGPIYHSLMLDDSPVVRSAGKKRLREELDYGDEILE